MRVRYGVWILVLATAAGCVEISQMLLPPPREPPAPNFNNNAAPNANGNDNVSTNGNVNDNVDTNANVNDNVTTNGNDNSGDDENANDNDGTNEEDAIFGGVGDIPPLEGEVVTTDSGLQYVDITVGSGEMPLSTSNVTVNYVGWLTDGTEFDGNDGAQFSLGGVIEGWTEGVGSMREGGSRRLLIPPDLAYGEGGSPPTIPPNATLIFDIDLLDIEN